MPKYRRFLTPLQQTTFENIVTKEEIAHNEQFLLLHNIFNYFHSLYFHIRGSGHFELNVFKVVFCRFVVCWKRLKCMIPITGLFSFVFPFKKRKQYAISVDIARIDIALRSFSRAAKCCIGTRSFGGVLFSQARATQPKQLVRNKFSPYWCNNLYYYITYK